jgi:Flp pilus assembly protein TadB
LTDFASYKKSGRSIKERPDFLAVVLVLVLIVLVVLLVLLIVLLVLILILVIHCLVLRSSFCAAIRDGSLPGYSGFILCFKN